ncbi:hypothetical protein GCM10011309_15810 [Litorimonas cladophorae]|uniref:IrrE N-terminal-like domain-containing protein n=2 Tax=Litorimonas cladophorae TaxID=1220491 RepID=A0A918KKP9_9PROT|nr:hypothetical protein GCM10011309_15810 [Litorimonas cladophorae]
MFSRNLIDPDVAEWQFDGFAWLIDNFETKPALADSPLILPTPDFFPEIDALSPTQADHIFRLVKAQCGFNEGDIFELEGKSGRPDASLGGLAMVETTGDTACGTYQLIPSKVGNPREIIRYDLGLENKPAQLIATFAHELSHALHTRAKAQLEIEPELYELFTDLTAIFLGYGVFLANTRFEFSQFTNADTQGWQAQGAGYLPEADMVFATALFMRIKNMPKETATPHLKPRLRKMLKKAWRQLDKNMDEVEALRVRVPLAD